MKIILLFAAALSNASLKTVASELSALTPNACPNVHSYNVTVRQSHRASTVSRYTVTCFAIPPVCSKYRTSYYVTYSTVYETKTNTTYECCAGYHQVGTTCVPCDEGRFGTNCEGICSCQNGNCDKKTGHCDCLAGWKGNQCEFPCDSGSHGQDCVHECDCKNGAGCDPQDGSCICRSGFKGKKCESPCDDGTWGHGCAHKCSCLNGATCLSTSGICVCAPGYVGEHCQDPCPPDTYGDECLEHCSCQNNAWCEHKGGRCLCGPGYTGTYCEKKCQPWYYGFQCESLCSCSMNTTDHCDPISGKCICLPGWTGSQCETQCPERTWGRGCNNICTCSDYIPCHHVSGECLCYPGWRGSNCTEKCPNGTFGERCEEECPVCPANATCNAIYGFCECPLGYIGHDCNEVCSPGSYGMMCSERCNCGKGYECSHVFGCVAVKSSTEEKLALSGRNENGTGLLTILGAICAVMVFVSVIVLWIVCQRKKQMKKQSTVSLHPVQEDANDPSLRYSKTSYGTADNIYQEISASKSPFPLLDPLYENEEESCVVNCSGRISTYPKQGLGLYANECNEDIYHEVDYTTASCSGKRVECDDAAKGYAHINYIYGMEEDENEKAKTESSQPGIYSTLNLEENKRESNQVYSYDRLKRFH